MRADERLLLRMEFYMFTQMVGSKERLFAERTLESFLLSVHYQVILPVAFFGKGFRAKGTLIRILSRMPFHMEFKTVHAEECLGTMFTSMDLFSCPGKINVLIFYGC
jgi:hypothetical protein